MRKIYILILHVFISCIYVLAQPGWGDMVSKQIYWRATLSTPGGELPFIIQTTGETELHIDEISVLNGAEKITTSEIKYIYVDDTVNNKKISSYNIEFSLPVFNSVISASFSEDFREMHGTYTDRSRPGNYFLRFDAVQTDTLYRFIKNPLFPKSNITGKWDAIFKDESTTDSTIGIFEQTANHLTGTFLTTTGDYRFLEGDVSADSFYLSTFNGSHAFLFKGKINDDGTLSGNYWSGKHYYATFTAARNTNAQLPDPTKLTYLKNGYSKIDFTFPDENGQMISLNDEQFKNKVIIISIMGSWCPNCMDETSYLSQFYNEYKNRGVEIIALAFERQPDAVNFKKNIDKLKEHFGINYTILNAGSNKNASDALPMLNKVMSFPTTIILDKNHAVKEIYTGFNGPATGNLFVEYQKKFETLINQLLNL